jgi:hypothetical protein
MRKNSKNRRSEPFIQIGSEVLNSLAYLDLSFSARAMLIEVLHYHNGRNNGSIWISSKILQSRGFSKNTSTKALKELRSHGFLYMTKRGGSISGGCSWFAITWLRVNACLGQNLENFIPNAYKKWIPKEKRDRANFGVVQPHKLGLPSSSLFIQ